MASDKLDAKLREIAEQLGGGEVRAGFLEDAKYPDGTSVAMVAAIQNFGAPNAGIPARPFFTKVVEAGKDEWGPKVGKIAKAVNYDADKLLPLVGEMIVGDIQQSIRDTNSPPLAPATVEAKGFPKPLIDTSHMINSTAYEVSK